MVGVPRKKAKGTTIVERYRVKYGLSQQALASLLYVHWITVNRWERGRTPVPQDIEDRLQGMPLPKQLII